MSSSYMRPIGNTKPCLVGDGKGSPLTWISYSTRTACVPCRPDRPRRAGRPSDVRPCTGRQHGSVALRLECDCRLLSLSGSCIGATAVGVMALRRLPVAFATIGRSWDT